jgi:hypothetical protein
MSGVLCMHPLPGLRALILHQKANISVIFPSHPLELLFRRQQLGPSLDSSIHSQWLPKLVSDHDNLGSGLPARVSLLQNT